MLLRCFGKLGKQNRSFFENIIQWWEVGKAHIRDFSQKYASFSSVPLKDTLKWLETEIINIEMSMIANDDANLKDIWSEKKSHLSSLLDERVKGVLIRNRFLTLKDIDAPTSYFFLFGV